MLLFVLASLVVVSGGVYGWTQKTEEKTAPVPAQEVKMCDLKVPVLFIKGKPAAVAPPGFVCPEATPAPAKKHLKAGGTGSHKLQ